LLNVLKSIFSKIRAERKEQQKEIKKGRKARKLMSAPVP
jgi:hypothetical protein